MRDTIEPVPYPDVGMAVPESFRCRRPCGSEFAIPTLPALSIVNLSTAVSPSRFVCITSLPPDPVSVVTLILAKTSAEEAFLKFKVGVSSTSIVMSPEDRVPLAIVFPAAVRVRALIPDVPPA